MFNVERFIMIIFPTKNVSILSNKLVKFGLVLVIAFPFVFYSLTIVTTGLDYDESKHATCITYPQWFNLIIYLSMMDIFFTIFMPFMTIMFVNMCIYLKLLGVNRMRNRISTRQRTKVRMSSRSTRNLIVLSLSFIILNSLMAFSKFKMFFTTEETGPSQNFMMFNYTKNYNYSVAWNELNDDVKSTSNDQESDDLTSQIIDRMATNLYYLNYSINFFLYLFYGSEFRKAFVMFLKVHSFF